MNSIESPRRDCLHQRQMCHQTCHRLSIMGDSMARRRSPMLETFGDIKIYTVIKSAAAQELLQREARMLKWRLPVLTAMRPFMSIWRDVLRRIRIDLIIEYVIIVSSIQTILDIYQRDDISCREGIDSQNSTDEILCTVSPGRTVATRAALLTTHRKTSSLIVIRPSVP